MRHVSGAAFALLLTACGGGGGSDEPASTGTTSTAAPDGPKTYSTIEELVQDAIAAGIDCPYLETPLRQRLSADSRYCATKKDGDVTGLPTFDIYATGGDLEKGRREAIEFAKIDVEYGDTPNSILVGPNWIVGGPLDQVATASDSMGGVVQNLENVAID